MAGELAGERLWRVIPAMHDGAWMHQSNQRDVATTRRAGWATQNRRQN
jgi:hypothetical protein